MNAAKPSTIAMIPVRIGSERLRQKNLIEVNGRPLMTYAIEAALNSGSFDRVIVNGDNPIFEDIAKSWGAEFYLRPEPLGGSEVQSDDVVNDFLQKFEADVVAWVNTTTPLQTASDIGATLTQFHTRGLDSAITAERRYSHAEIDGKPLNFSRDTRFARTQDLPPVDLFNYAMMIWRREVFLTAYAAHGYALFCGTFGSIPIPKTSGTMVKTADDIIIVEALIAAGAPR